MELSLDNQDFDESHRLITYLEKHTNSNSQSYVELLIQKSRYSESIEDNQSSEEVCRRAIEKAQILDYPLGLARAYCQLAFSLYLTGSSTILSKELKEEMKQERYSAINEASQILNTLDNRSISDPKLELLFTKTQALLLDYKGIFELEKGFLTQAIDYFKQSFDLSSTINYNYVTSVALNNLAICYLKLGDFDGATDAIEKKISLIKKTGNAKELTLAYSIKGDIYRELGQLEKALEFKKLIFDLGESLERPNLVSFGLGSMAEIYFEMGEFELAKSYFSKSATILQENFGKERHFSLNYTKLALGVIARYEMNYPLSIQYFKSILDNL